MFGEQILKASLTESTKAVYSLANRAYYAEGQMYKGNPAVVVGDYFTRPNNSNKTYFVETIIPEPLAPDLIYACCIECNVTIDIKRKSGESTRDRNSSLVPRVYETIYSGINCYRDVATRSNKYTSDGALDQSIYSVILPHRFMLSEGDIVVMQNNISGADGKSEFSVESVGSQVIGSDIAQLLFKCNVGN